MTLKEIAQQAGVSPSTVSMVLNGKGSVSADTRERLSRILGDYGYEIRGKQKQERRGIYFINFRSHANPAQESVGVLSTIVDAIAHEARRLGFELVMTDCNEGNITQVGEHLSEKIYDGIILLGTELESEDIAYFTDLTPPFVILDNPAEKYDINSVTVNNQESIRNSIDHLYKLGHREIGYLYSKMPSGNCRARKNFYEIVLAEYGLRAEPQYIYQVGPTSSMAYNDTFELLHSGAEYSSAFLASSDSIAIGAVRAFRDYGIKNPSEVSIMGFDDILYAEAIDPPLTTLRVPYWDMGAWAVRLLADRMCYPCSPTAKVQLSTTLVPRKSSGPIQV